MYLWCLIFSGSFDAWTISLFVFFIAPFKAFVGTWSISLGNNELPVKVTIIGEVILHPDTAHTRTSKLQPSNNTLVFPTTDGWWRVDNLAFDNTWDYVKFQTNRTMLVHHFCGYSDNPDCQRTYQGLSKYCCPGEGKRKEKKRKDLGKNVII